MMSISDSGRALVWPLVITGVAILVALLAIPTWQHMNEAPPASIPAFRLAFVPPEDATLGAGVGYPFGLAVAPDGRRIVFPAAKAGLTQLWLLDLTTATGNALPG